MPEVSLHLGNCLDILPGIPDGSVDAVISDPLYPEIDRP
jgi:DNA modification methylase